MQRITVKISDALASRLHHEAERRQVTTSEISREALEAYFDMQRGPRELGAAASGHSGRTDISERTGGWQDRTLPADRDPDQGGRRQAAHRDARIYASSTDPDLESDAYAQWASGVASQVSAHLDALAPVTDTSDPGPEWKIDQARLLRDRLQTVRDEFGLLRSSDVSALSAARTGNASANPTRWSRSGKAIAIRVTAGDLYPGFQFDLTTGMPLPVMADLIAAWGDGDPVGLVLWCIAPNEWLDGERPADLLSRHPEQVRRAMQHAVER